MRKLILLGMATVAFVVGGASSAFALVTPAALDFGSVPLHTTAGPKIANKYFSPFDFHASIVLTQQGAGNFDFNAQASCHLGQPCPVSVVAHPTQVGPITGQITWYSDTGTDQVQLSVTGVDPCPPVQGKLATRLALRLRCLLSADDALTKAKCLVQLGLASERKLEARLGRYLAGKAPDPISTDGKPKLLKPVFKLYNLLVGADISPNAPKGSKTADQLWDAVIKDPDTAVQAFDHLPQFYMALDKRQANQAVAYVVQMEGVSACYALLNAP